MHQPAREVFSSLRRRTRGWTIRLMLFALKLVLREVA